MLNKTGIELESNVSAATFVFHFQKDSYNKGVPIFNIGSKEKKEDTVFSLTIDNYGDFSNRLQYSELKAPIGGGWEFISKPFEDPNEFSFKYIKDFLDFIEKYESKEYTSRENIIINENALYKILPSYEFSTVINNTKIDYVYPRYKKAECAVGIPYIEFLDNIMKTKESNLLDQLNIQKLTLHELYRRSLFDVGQHLTFSFPYETISNFYTKIPQALQANHEFFEVGFYPFSPDSYKRFKETLSSNEVFNIIELVKYYLYMSSLDKRPDVRNIGYKAYFPVMSRVSFSSMLSNLQLNDSSLNHKIFLYIFSCLKDKGFTPFNNLYTEGSIKNKKKEIYYMKNEDLIEKTRENINTDNLVESLFNYQAPRKSLENYKQNIITYLFNNLCISKNIPSSFQQQTYKRFVDSLIQCFKTEELTPEANEIVQNIVYNSAFYDYFSPVPMSPPNESMGAFSREKGTLTPVIEYRPFTLFKPGITFDEAEKRVKNCIIANIENWNDEQRELL